MNVPELRTPAQIRHFLRELREAKFLKKQLRRFMESLKGHLYFFCSLFLRKKIAVDTTGAEDQCKIKVETYSANSVCIRVAALQQITLDKNIDDTCTRCLRLSPLSSLPYSRGLSPCIFTAIKVQDIT
jgi:hypothetical protein